MLQLNLIKNEGEILTQMAGIFRDMWRARAAQEPKLDLISMMAHNQAMSEISEAQYIGNLVLLLVGGYDTTKNSMTGGIFALSENPNQWEVLRSNPSLVPSLVGEIIRFQTLLIHMFVTATHDIDLDSQLIRSGDRIVLWYISANRDETVIDNPDKFIINRQKPHKHLSFGAGIHRCVGDLLAILQLRFLWGEILSQAVVVEVVGQPTR